MRTSSSHNQQISCENFTTKASTIKKLATHSPFLSSSAHSMPITNTLAFATVDVFTTTPFKGNQLAVVRIPPELNLSQETKQTIACEFNLSETVFLHDPQVSHAQRRLDIFTLSQELPFAGHPVIGAACYICQHLETETDQTIMLCKAGPVTCHYDRKDNFMEVETPHNVHIHSQTVSGKAVLKTQPYLSNILAATYDFPIVSLVRGLSFILINLPSITPYMEKLEAGTACIDPSSAKLDEGWEPSLIGFYFYVIISHPNEIVQKIRTRMLEPSVGEEAATGSAACTLACYLALKDGGSGRTYQYSIEQGVEMGRASEIHVRVTLDTESKTVHSVVLAGRAVLVTQGLLHLP